MHDMTQKHSPGRIVLGPQAFREMLPPAFFQETYQKTFLHMPGVIPRDVTRRLLTLEKLDDMLQIQRVIADSVHVVSDGVGASKFTAKTEDGLLDCYGLRKQIAAGATARMTNAQEFDVQIREVCEALETVVGQSVNANAYITPAGNQGFNPHYDAHDVFIFQCVGRKAWKIYHDYAGQMELPNQRNRFQRELHKPTSERIETFVLEEGDLLYIPRGIMHDARCEADYSCHVTFGVHAMSWTDYLIEACNMLNGKELAFRHTASVRPFSDTQDFSEARPCLSELMRMILDMDPAQVERSLFRKAVSKNGNLASGTFSVAMKMAFDPDLSSSDYFLSFEKGVALRIFRDKKDQWHMWTYQNECTLQDTEAELLQDLKASGMLHSSRIRAALGKEDGDAFSNTLILAGLAKVLHPTAD